MVGHGSESFAKEWAKTSEFDFPLFVDPEARIFRELGLKRSVLGTWSVQILVNFAEKGLRGKLEFFHEDDADLHLMAGDYLADSAGKLLLSHNGRSADDRPDIKTILDTIDKAR